MSILERLSCLLHRESATSPQRGITPLLDVTHEDEATGLVFGGKGKNAWTGFALEIGLTDQAQAAETFDRILSICPDDSELLFALASRAGKEARLVTSDAEASTALPTDVHELKAVRSAWRDEPRNRPREKSMFLFLRRRGSPPELMAICQEHLSHLAYQSGVAKHRVLSLSALQAVLAPLCGDALATHEPSADGREPVAITSVVMEAENSPHMEQGAATYLLQTWSHLDHIHEMALVWMYTFVQVGRYDEARNQLLLAEQRSGWLPDRRPQAVAKRRKREDLLLAANMGSRLVQARHGVVVCGPADLAHRAMTSVLSRYRQAELRGDLASLTDASVRARALPWSMPLQARSADAWMLAKTAAQMASAQPQWNGPSQRPSLRDTLLETPQGAVGRLLPGDGTYQGNVYVTGCAGAGASFLADEILLNHVIGGGHAWVIRWSENRNLDLHLRARYVEFRRGVRFSLNPFSVLRSHRDLVHLEHTLLEWVMGLAATYPQDYSHDLVMRGEVSRAMTRAWERLAAQMSIYDVIDELNDVDAYVREFAHQLSVKISRFETDWLTGPCTVPLAAACVSFDVSGMRQNLKHAALAGTVLALFNVMAHVSDRQTPKLFVLHELETMSDPVSSRGNSDFARLLQFSMRDARCTNASFVLTGQPPQLGRFSALEQVVLDARPQLLALNAPAHAVAWLTDYLSKEQLAQLWPHVQRMRDGNIFVWIRDQGAGLFTLRVDPLSKWLLGSCHSRDASSYFRSRDKGLSSVQALQELESASRRKTSS